MIPISARLPDHLHEWLSLTPLEDATTLSDKLRVAVAHLKRLHDGSAEYISTLSVYRDLGRSARTRIAALEQSSGTHSEVLAAMAEHLPSLLATLHASEIATQEDARSLEAALTRKTMQLAEALLRQAVTRNAAAFDTQVVQQNIGPVLELCQLISANQGKVP